MERVLKVGGLLTITTDICYTNAYRFSSNSIDTALMPYGFDTDISPTDVIKSDDTPIGIVSGRGLRVFGFILQKEK